MRGHPQTIVLLFSDFVGHSRCLEHRLGVTRQFRSHTIHTRMPAALTLQFCDAPYWNIGRIVKGISLESPEQDKS